MSNKVNPKNPYKKEEFEAFLGVIRGSTTAHWIQIANVLGVDKTTITEWRKHPLAKEAIRKGIDKALKGMERAGRNDWRMWESKLKMLGVYPVDKSMQDITSNDKSIPILAGFNYVKPNREKRT